MDDYKIAGHQVVERWVSSSIPEPNTKVFFRAVGDPNKPHLVYFEGGPGGTLPRPTADNPLLKLAEEYRLVFIDSRGTGLSTPVNENTFSTLSETEQVKLLSTHRADTFGIGLLA